MRRLFWLAMGATIGVLVVRKLTRVAERLTPRGMADGIGSGMRELADAIRTFSDDVRDAMREREVELREGAGLDGELGNRPSAPGRHAAGDPEAPPA